MADDETVLVDDERVPLAVHALLGVVVADSLVGAEGVVEVDCLLDEGLRVGRGVGLAGALLSPA